VGAALAAFIEAKVSPTMLPTMIRDKVNNMIESELGIAITDEYIATYEADTVFGKRWGDEIVTLTQEQLDALQQGRYLVIDVQSEYVVYLKTASKENNHE
jgi:hypothetical protein